MTTPGPHTDAEIPAYLDDLGLPGLADIHVHFMPDSVLRKVWRYFDAAERHYGLTWPIHYRLPEPRRISLLRAFRVAAIPALNYAHRPGMAAWLNDWSGEFARRVPEAIRCATFYPEPGVTDYLARAVDDGTRLVKVHLQVGGFSPVDPLLDGAWALLAARRIPVVMHAGSGPIRGEFTGPSPVRELLDRHPDLTVVIAHLGMPEYEAFADLAAEREHVYLDTTMAATDFTNAIAPLPDGFGTRLAALRSKIVLGSDFPNIPYAYADQITALARLDQGDGWMRDVLWHNGRRLLRLA
jgi:predicted TIM-barrel fold metal-dependent hydrolase